MNKLTFAAIFALVISMTASGVTSSVFAQEDLSILLNLALRAQNQVQNQISNTNNVSSDITALFEEGKKQVSALDYSIKNNDAASAKKNFLSAMNIFKKISSLLEQSKPQPQAKTTITITVNDPTSELNRLYVYIQNLKLAAKNYNFSINFSNIDSLISDAKDKISKGQFDEARTIMTDIKQESSLIIKKLNDYVQEQNNLRARVYAQSYLEQLDRLISASKSQGVSQDVLDKLTLARENLANATSTSEIIYHVKQILLIKKQFELTKADRVEANLIQVQKMIDRLSNVDGVSQQQIDELQKQLEDVKSSISSGDFQGANNILISTVNQINLIKKSTTT